MANMKIKFGRCEETVYLEVSSRGKDAELYVKYHDKMFYSPEVSAFALNVEEAREFLNKFTDALALLEKRSLEDHEES